MIKNIILLIITSLILSSCSEAYELSELYKQQILNSNKQIYYFSAWSKYNDSSIAGCVILDSNEVFDFFKYKELPFTYFDGMPTNKKIKLIHIISPFNFTTEKDTLLVPIKHYFKKHDGFDIEISEYNHTYGGGAVNTGLREYSFEDYSESTDSLTFYNVKWRDKNEILYSNLTLQKGNVKIIEDNNGKIISINIDQFICIKGGIYEPTNPLKLIENRPNVGFKYYQFYPINTIYSNGLSNIGIYKKVKI